MNIRKKYSYIFLLICLFAGKSFAQVSVIGAGPDVSIDYSNPKEYEIAGVTVSGVQFLDEKVLITLSGLNVGDKVMVPGDKIAKAIENLWKQGLLSDIRIVATRIVENKIFLELRLQERPRLSKFAFEGVTKSEADKLREKIKLVSGKIITENLVQTTENEVKKYFVDKGFLNASVKIDLKNEPNLANSQMLNIVVDKKKKVKVNSIVFEGVTQISEAKLRRKMKDTKVKHFYRLFSTSKFIEDSYETDKEKMLAEFRKEGFRDAKVVSDSVSVHDEKSVDIAIKISEGSKY